MSAHSSGSPAKTQKNSRGFSRFRSEEGSALVLVMFIFLLLMILGMGVLSATLGGARRAETRENDVQSLHLAQKGLEEATAYITSQVDGLTDIDPDQLGNVLEDLNKQNLNVSTSLGGSSSGTIDSIHYNGMEEVTDSSQLSRQYTIDVTASADVNGVKRTLSQKITIDTYPDFLKYAFGSEENVYLNGSPVLMGNIYAGNKLYISNRAQYTYNGNSSWRADTLFPTLKQNDGDENSGEVYVQSLSSIEYADGGADFTSVDTAKNIDQTLQNILGVGMSKVKVKERKKFVQINVEESFLDKLAEAYHADSVTADSLGNMNKDQLTVWLQNENNTRGYLTPLSQESPPAKPEQAEDEESQDYQARLDKYYADLDKYKHTFMNLQNSVIVNGNLTIDGIDYLGLTYTDQAKQGTGESNPPKWLIVNGDLTLSNLKSDYLQVKGNILVTGDVKIKGNVAFDSTVFVLGRTTAEDAVIDGIGEGSNKKELVLISKGQVLVTRIDAFTPVSANAAAGSEPREMKAFFYTDSSAELYGVGSVFWLNGGFFAKGDLTVNAMLGNTTEPAGGAASGQPLLFTPQEEGASERFRIHYNHEVYTHQQSSLPRVSRVNISVGPLRIVRQNP